MNGTATCIILAAGFYDHQMVRELLKECKKMCSFDHPNILTLRGMCLDGGPIPYLIMPFMANGSLLSYLRNNRKSIVIDKDDGEEKVISNDKLQAQ